MSVYSKVRQYSPLDNALRETIYRTIRATPGINYVKVRATVSQSRPTIGLGTLTYHLVQLERFGLVSSRRVGRFRRFWSAHEHSARNVVHAALAEGGPSAFLLEQISREPGLTARVLRARMISCHPMTLPGVLYHLRLLEREQLITVQCEGRRRYFPAPAAKARTQSP